MLAAGSAARSWRARWIPIPHARKANEMSTPAPPASLPIPPNIGTGSFRGKPVPTHVVAEVVNLLITGAPLASSFTRQDTDRSAIAWPTASPTGFAWLRELQEFPVIDPGDDAYVVAVAKIGGIIDMSNETVSDNAINLTTALATLLQDSLSRDLDLGLLNGGGPPEPVGVLGVAPPVTGADLLAAVAAARGQISDAGGAPDTIAISGTALANADTDRDTAGQLVYPSGFAAAVGLNAVVVPELPTPLVFDSSRCFTVVRDDARVELSTDWHFQFDATSTRIKARVAAAIPDVNKAIRKLAGAGGASAAARTASAHSGTAKTKAAKN